MQQRKVLRVIRDNFLLFLVYYLAGHLSMEFLATPPSNAAAIWPPAGISLAAVLACGYSVLPAVFIGDLVIAMEIFGFADFSAIVFSLMVGFQACWAAWFGGFLINGLLGKNNPLLDNRSIVMFLLLGGPVSHIGPSVLAIATELWLDEAANAEKSGSSR
ncbi:MASE1 domain-containing protein [Methylomarinum vadi]|uniref:MASE1 domain-containing protein n=1 Tax=Methylomarinum vadi TaxID=438855 RepID=UPI0004DF583B|nr:MASE1 domain-containing protein [Methylomarinum vadi]